MTRPAGPERAAAMVAMARQGASLREIGDQFGMARETARRCLSRAGVSTAAFEEARLARRAARRAAWWEEVVDQHGEEAERLWREGALTPEVAKALGVPLRVAAALVRERITEGERRRRRGEARGKELWPPEATFAALRQAATILGCTPGQKAYDRLLGEGQISGPSSGRIVQRFGWAAACREAGLEPNRRHPSGRFGAPKYSEQAMTRALLRVQRELGKRPSHGSYASRRRPDEPSAGTIRLRFGRWLAALDALLGEETDIPQTKGTRWRTQQAHARSALPVRPSPALPWRSRCCRCRAPRSPGICFPPAAS